MRMNRNKSQLLMIVLAVGFFVGIIYQNMIVNSSVVTSELFLKSNLERYLQTNIIAEKYLWYVIKSRITLLAIVYVFSCFRWKKLYVSVCLFAVGFFAGIMAVAAVMQFGLKGILLCVAGVLPQGIFYVMVYSMLFSYWFRYPDSRWNRTKTVFLVVAYLLGILSETYVNPMLMKMIIRIL